MAEEAKATEAVPTPRVVLAGFEVPRGALPDDLKDHLLIKGRQGSAQKLTVWVEVGAGDGPKDQVIGKLARTPDGEEIPGRYRAPSKRSWKGGLELAEPEQQRLDRKAFE